MATTRKNTEAAERAPWYMTGEGWGRSFAENPAALIVALLLIAGSIFILDINDWYFDAPVFFLILGWSAVTVSAWLLWRSGVAAATEGYAEDEDFDLEETPQEELEREKKQLLRAIRDIEFDRELGKMSEEQASGIIAVYRRRAVEILKLLSGEQVSNLSPAERIERDLEARLALAPGGGRSQRGKLLAAAEAAVPKAKSLGELAAAQAAQEATKAGSRPGSTGGASRGGTLPSPTSRREFAADMIADAEDEDDLDPRGGTDA